MKENSSASETKHYKHKILHIDDDCDMICLFQNQIGKYMEVTSCCDPREAVYRLEKGSYHAVVIDYDMPEMNGIEVVKQLKKDHPYLPIIFYTGHKNLEVAKEAQLHGVSDFLTKDMEGLNHWEKLCVSIYNSIEQKKAEEALKKSEEKYRNLVETLQDLVFSCNREGIVTYVNKAFEEICAFKDEKEVIGSHIKEYICIKESEKIKQAFLQVVDHGQAFWGFECCIRNRKGETRYISFNATPIINESGKITGITGVGRDITKWKEMEDTLKRREAQYKLLYDESQIVNILINQRGTIIDVNNACLEMLQLSKEEVIDRHILSLAAHEHQEIAAKILEKHLRNEKRGDVLLNIPSPQGIRKFMLCKRSIRLEQDKRKVNILLNGVDLTGQLTENLPASVEKEFDFFFNNTVDMIWKTDGNLVITYVNPSMEKSLGFKWNMLKDRSLPDFLFEDSKDLIMQTIADNAQDINSKEFTFSNFQYISLKGEIIDTDLSILLHKNSDGIITGISGLSKVI